MLYIETDGGLNETSGFSTGYSDVEIAIFIDGARLAEISGAGLRRIVATNTAGFSRMPATWSLAAPLTVAPGAHTIDVRASFLDGTAAADVSGPPGDYRQGILNVLVLKK